MQTIEFLETAKWIRSQYNAVTRDILLSGNLWSFLRANPATKGTEHLSTIFIISNDLAIVNERLKTHPFAPKVLLAFGLSILMDKDFPVTFATKASAMEPDEVLRTQDEFTMQVRDIYSCWKVLSECIEPVEGLIVPKDVMNEKAFDEILTFELKYDRQNNPQAQTISELLGNAARLYEAVAIASGYEEYTPLLVVYADSGSAFRFDLKGLGEPVKQIKSIFIDVWNTIRHRKAVDFRSNGKAIIEGLDILDKIEAKRRKNVLSAEEASRLKLHINRAMLGLFEAGVLPREVPVVESVQNDKLMQGIQQKLLPPAPDEDRSKKSRPSKKSKKKRNKTSDAT